MKFWMRLLAHNLFYAGICLCFFAAGYLAGATF